MKRLLYFFLFLVFFPVLAKSQTNQTIKLTQLERGQAGGVPVGGLIGLTRDSDGKQRYATYVEINPVCIAFTPPATGNTTNYSQFVTKCSTDSVWYIDYQGNSILLGTTGGGGGNPDRDWLKISDNQIPYAISDSIYTGKYAAVNMRRVWPSAQFLVGDSTNVLGATSIVAGDRSARQGYYRLNDSSWVSMGMEGGSLVGRLGYNSGSFVIQKVGGWNPAAATAPFRDIARFNADSTIQFLDFPRTRVDTSTVVNFLYTDPDGFLQSRPVTDISGGNGIYGGSGQVPNNTEAVFLDQGGFFTSQDTNYRASIEFNKVVQRNGTVSPEPGYLFMHSGENSENIAYVGVNADEHTSVIGAAFKNEFDTRIVAGPTSLAIEARNSGPFSPTSIFTDNSTNHFVLSAMDSLGLEYQLNYSAKILTNDRSVPDVGTTKLIPFNVAADMSGTLANPQIKANAVGATELATDAVTTAKIANGNVTMPKLAGGSNPWANIHWDGTAVQFSPQKRVGYTTITQPNASSTVTIPSGGGTYSRYFIYLPNGGTDCTIELPQPLDGQILELLFYADGNAVSLIDLSGAWEIVGRSSYSLSGTTIDASVSVKLTGLANVGTGTTVWVNEDKGPQTPATNLSWTGTTNNVTLNSSTGTDVGILGGGGVTITPSGATITLNAADISATNEGTLGVGAGGATSSVILSNTSGATGVTFNVAGALSIAETTSSNGGSITITGSGVTTAGAFQTATNANGLSVSGADMRLHQATSTTPGGVSAADQTFGGEKTFEKNGAGTAQAITANNNTATDGDGSAIAIALAGTDRFQVSAVNPAGAFTNQTVFQAETGSGFAEFLSYLGDIRATKISDAIEVDLTAVSGATVTATGRESFLYIPESSATTSIVLPEIVTGVPGVNQVRVGYTLEVMADLRGTSICAVNRSGTSDQILSGDTLYTSLNLTALVPQRIHLLAMAADLWFISISF